MSRTVKIVIGTVIVLLLGWYIASPYIALHQMRSAAENRDAEALSEHIDFPALKEDLKASFSAKMMTEAAKAPSDEPFAAAGSALAMAMIGPMIDAMVTPQAVAMMMKSEKPSPANLAEQSSDSKREPNVSASYEGLNTFAVTVSEPDDQTSSFKLIFKRHGFFNWKLTSAELPM